MVELILISIYNLNCDLQTKLTPNSLASNKTSYGFNENLM